MQEDDAPAGTADTVGGNAAMTNGSLLYLAATVMLIGSGFFTWFTATNNGLACIDDSIRAQFSAVETSLGLDSLWGWLVPVLLAGTVTIDLFSGAAREFIKPLGHPIAPLIVGILAAVGVTTAVVPGDTLGRFAQTTATFCEIGVDSSTSTAAWFAVVAAIGLVVAGEMIRRERTKAGACTEAGER